MSCVYMTSDWHLGHKKAYQFSGEFDSQEEREGTIIENYASVINKRDYVWFLGDIAFTLKDLELISMLQGTKILVLGNHDTDRFAKDVQIENLVLTFDNVYGIANYKHSWLTHAPIHPDELRGKWNVHGHVHDATLDDPRYYNACLENTEFKPVKYQDIIAEMKERERNE